MLQWENKDKNKSQTQTFKTILFLFLLTLAELQNLFLVNLKTCAKLNQICQWMKVLVFSYKMLDLLTDKKYESEVATKKVFFVRSPPLWSTFCQRNLKSKFVLTNFIFYFIMMWRQSVSEVSDEKNKTTAITSICVILCDLEDGYMNYELEMKQMFHKVSPFIYCAILWNILSNLIGAAWNKSFIKENYQKIVHLLLVLLYCK
jgi:hypothetical protein